MPAHAIAEQDEIALLNHLKAVFNSIRSTIQLTIAQTEFLEGEEALFLLERIKLFEKEIGKLKLNQQINATLKKGLKEFKKKVSTTPVHLVVKTFQNLVVIPLETKMLELHSTKEEKNWVRTMFVIVR